MGLHFTGEAASRWEGRVDLRGYAGSSRFVDQLGRAFSAEVAVARSMEQVNHPGVERSATMRRSACALMIVGFVSLHASAAEPPLAPSNVAPYAATGHVQMTSGSCGTSCQGDCQGGGKRSGDRLNKLIDFLLYRPTPGCDCCPQTTSYVPPLHAWFPPCCHANGQNGCVAGCNKCGLKK